MGISYLNGYCQDFWVGRGVSRKFCERENTTRMHTKRRKKLRENVCGHLFSELRETIRKLMGSKVEGGRGPEGHWGCLATATPPLLLPLTFAILPPPLFSPTCNFHLPFTTEEALNFLYKLYTAPVHAKTNTCIAQVLSIFINCHSDQALHW